MTELRLSEPFGVGHPRQLVEFEIPPDARQGPLRLENLAGEAVAAQRLGNGRLAVLTDLPPFGERRWRLRRLTASEEPPEAVRVQLHHAWYEITNGLTGVRLTRMPGNLSRVPAPIQGIRHRDGTWTATGPNDLEGSDGRPLAAIAAGVRFLERGPLKVVAEVTYRLDGQTQAVAATAVRYYRSRIEIQAAQPVILIEDETNVGVRYRLDVWEGLHPDQARYRGHHSTAVERGREPDGRQYRLDHERTPMDALVDLPGSQPLAGRSTEFIGRLAVWDPWMADGGWYWQLYDSRGGPGANVLGVFAGRASRALGATASGARVYASAVGPTGHPTAGLLAELLPQPPDGRVFPRVRVAWGVFVGSQGVDLGDPRTVQAIARQINVHAGINLAKLQAVMNADAIGLDPRRALYTDPRHVAQAAERVRLDETYYRRLHAEEPNAHPLLDHWRAPSDATRTVLVQAVVGPARTLLEALVHGDGTHDPRAGYWLGGLTMTRLVPWIGALLIDPGISPEDRARIEAVARLFATVLWDDDLVPLFEGHGLHLGTENMPVQQREYRSQYALLLGDHPRFRALADRVATDEAERLRAVVDETGAHMSSTHYVIASMGPLVTTLQQLKAAGLDLFRTEPRLARFAEFYLNLLTPPEPRFGGRRKLIPVGDGSTEASELFGQLGTGFADSNPGLSGRLMGAWRESGSPHAGFHGTTVLKIDDNLPARDVALGSASFPGWYSVVRSESGTPQETAVWLVHGTTYRDHYHADNGGVVVYALGAPVSLDWGSMGYPRAAGGVMHSVILPERLFGHPWDRPGPALDGGPRWGVSGSPSFAAFPQSAHAEARFALASHAWTREVDLIHGEPGHPVIRIRDRVTTSPHPEAPNVLTLNLAAQGPVETPTGVLVPRVVDPARGELPSAGPVFPLAPGWARLSFTGQWLVDWDLLVWTPGGAHAHIGEWAHAWHPGREAAEFREAQQRPFEERQQILRVLGSGAFDVLLLPRRKGISGDPWTVRQVGAATELVRADWRLRLAGSGHALLSDFRTIVTATASEPLEFQGIRVEGGPIEVDLEDDAVRVTIHGEAGRRSLALPEGCLLEGRPPGPGGKWTVEYGGGTASRLAGRCERTRRTGG